MVSMQKILLVFLLIGLLDSCSKSSVVNSNNSIYEIPESPTELRGTVLSDSSIQLNWQDHSSNESGFIVERRLLGSTQFQIIDTLISNSVIYTDFSLAPYSTYEYKVCSFNAAGSALQYSNVIELTTFPRTNYSYSEGTVIHDIDANIYPSITTNCGQSWSTKNLNVSHYRNGDIIPQVTDSIEWSNLTSGAWCWYNNDSLHYSQFGKLYNWYAVNDIRGLSPAGWHIPTDSEWDIFTICIDPQADTTPSSVYPSFIAGGTMKDIGTAFWVSPNTGATNFSGFSALPSGARFTYGIFDSFGNQAFFWTSSEFNNYGWYRYMENGRAFLIRGNTYKSVGVAVRLIKD